MSIYITVPDADVSDKKPEQSEITQAVQTKNIYTGRSACNACTGSER